MQPINYYCEDFLSFPANTGLPFAFGLSKWKNHFREVIIIDNEGNYVGKINYLKGDYTNPNEIIPAIFDSEYIEELKGEKDEIKKAVFAFFEERFCAYLTEPIDYRISFVGKRYPIKAIIRNSK